MQSDHCLPIVSTISVGVSLLLGTVAVAHFFGKRKMPSVEPPQIASRGVQTDSCDIDAKRQKEIQSLQRQVKHQKTVACNMEEENECLTEQVSNLKKICGDRKHEIASLKGQLEHAHATIAQLSAALTKERSKPGPKKAGSPKKSDDEFQSAMALLLDLAEQSVTRELRTVGHDLVQASCGGNAIQDLKAEDFSAADWAFMMSVAGVNKDEASLGDDRECVGPQARSPDADTSTHVGLTDGSTAKPRSPSTKTAGRKTSTSLGKPERKPSVGSCTSTNELESTSHGDIDGVSNEASSTATELSATEVGPGNLSGERAASDNAAENPVPSSVENMSAEDGGKGPKEPKPKGKRRADPDFLDLSDLDNYGSWASETSSPAFSEAGGPDTAGVFSPNPNAAPFVPKRQHLQEEIQKRLQQWKDFYYSEVRPKEVANQQSHQSAARSVPQAAPPPTPQNKPGVPDRAPGAVPDPRGVEHPVEWHGDHGGYYQHQYSEHGWAGQAQPYDPNGWHAPESQPWPPGPYACAEGHAYAYQNALPLDLAHAVEPGCPAMHEGPQPVAAHVPQDMPPVAPPMPQDAPTAYPGDVFANDDIGLRFRFPALPTAPGSAVPAPQWTLAHEAQEPFFIMRFVPAKTLACQLVVTTEVLHNRCSLSSYVLLSKRQTEKTLAAYCLVFHSERQLRVCGHPAYEIVYTQGGQGERGDMLVWSLCVHTFNRALTLQIVASPEAKDVMAQSLEALLGSVQLAPPRRAQDVRAACVAIQMMGRAWLARRYVRRLRSHEAQRDMEENDVFIRVTTRINPEFSR